MQRTCAYISQIDNHIAELTVRETLDFAARCQGASHGFGGKFVLTSLILLNGSLFLNKMIFSAKFSQVYLSMCTAVYHLLVFKAFSMPYT